MKTIINAVSAILMLASLLAHSANCGDVEQAGTASASAMTPQLQTETTSGEEINWQVVSSGGENSGSSASYGLAGTVGQTSGGTGSSASYGINHGFWQVFATPVLCVAGDADGSGEVDIDDVVYLIGYIFSGGPAPTPDVCCGDADGSGDVDIDDVVYLIAYIFAGGPPPVDAC